MLNGLADRIRASYTPEKAWAEMSGELPAYLVYRPLSFYVTLPLLRAGVPTSAVTAFCAALVLALPAVAAFAGRYDYVAVAAIAFAFSVLDCVDGNLARVRAARGRFGALFDAAVDAAFWCALLGSFGLLVQKRSGWLAPYGLAVGLGAALVTLLGRRVRDEFRALYATRSEMDETRPAAIGAGQWVFIALAGLENVYGVAILAAGLAHALDGALVAVFVYALSVAAVSIALAHAKAARLDRVSRDGQ